MQSQVSYALIGDYWGGTVKAFRFSCEHSMKHEAIGNCLHRYTCTKCGFAETVDSSN